MKITLGENINKYRKEKNMTQEDLALALGVTFASVSKWERNIATPDLSLIMEMASIFGVSVDALIGYEIKKSTKDEINERIYENMKIKDYENAIKEIDNSLLKYPNDFDFVYGGAQVYYFSGMETFNNEQIRKSIELFEKSITLINQNDNPEVSEISIKGLMAECYIMLKEVDKGIDIFKKNNVRGLFNPNIAFAFTQQKEFNPKDVEPYLNNAIGNLINWILQTAIAYSDYFKVKKDYDKAIRGILWIKGIIESLKEDKNKISYLDKIIAYGYSKLAFLYYLSKDKENMNKCLKEAYYKAKAFDSNPIYKLGNTKFGIEEIDESYAADGLGDTATKSVEKVLMENDEIFKMWNELKGLK